MPVTPLPTPGLTPGGPENDYRWARELIEGIRTRHEDAVALVQEEAGFRSSADAGLQAQIDALADANTRATGPAKIGAIGASITAAGSLSYYDKVASGLIAFGYQGVMGSAILRTKGSFIAGGIAATAGFTTAQMVATWLPQVVATDWDYCIIGEATNDLLTGVPVATTKANIQTMVQDLIAAGIMPILSTCPPNDSHKTNPGRLWLLELNEWIIQYAWSLSLPVVDYHTALVDPGLNGFVASPSYTTDGTHPNAQGCKAMTDALIPVLDSLPGLVQVPRQGAYNPDLLLPDAVTTSVGADRMVGSGSVAGGWGYANMTSARWKGNAATVSRGSGDYLLGWPVTPGALVAGHRCRLAFGIDVPTGPWVGTGGNWSAYLWNLTQAQGVAGYSTMQWPTGDGTSVMALDGEVVLGVNAVVCNTSKPFRQYMVGNPIQVVTGFTPRFAGLTTIIGVSEDGSTAYLSANANANGTGLRVYVIGSPKVVGFEFDVQPDMVGDSFSFIVAVAGAVGTAVSISQITLADLTALGAA